jgi:hypothetical protein
MKIQRIPLITSVVLTALLTVAMPCRAADTNTPAATAQKSAREKVRLDLENSSLYQLTESSASVENGRLNFNTQTSQHVWNVCFRTHPGLFKPGKTYCVTLTCKTEEAGDDSNLLILIRPFEGGSARSDLACQPVFEFSGEKTVRLKFTVPDNASNYSLQIHTKKKASGYVKDIYIEELADCAFLPANEKRSPSVDLPAIPRGASEFSVDLPQPQTDTVVSVASFGASPSEEDNTRAFNDAIAKCAREKASRLIVPKGVYRFTSDDSILFERLKDFEFDGQGSTLVFLKKKNSIMRVSKCERVMFKNFNIDWDWEKDPLASVVKVEKVGPGASWVDFRFVDYEKFPRRDIRVAMIDMLDPSTMSVGCEGGFNIAYEFNKGQNKPQSEWLSDNLLRLTPGNGALKEGQLFRMAHYYYDMGGFNMSDNSHLTIQDVNVYSCPGMAFIVSGGQHHWQFIRTNVMRPPDSNRPITCTADHLHVGNSQGFFKMESCEFGLGADDCINIHDNSGYASKSSDTGLTLIYAKNISLYHEGDLIELRSAEYAPTGFKEKLKSVVTVDKSKNLYTLQFDKPLPGVVGDKFVIFNWRYDSRNVIIRNCYFHDNRARGLLLLARDVTVEDCRFVRNQMGAIKIETGYTIDSWREGYGASNIVIRDNVFEKVNPIANYPNELRPSIYISTYLESDPSTTKATYPIIHDILIEENKFIETSGAAVYACSAKNVIFRDNSIINRRSNLKEYSYRGAIGTAYSSNIFVTDNDWIGLKFNPNPGVFYDPETTRDVYCWSNRIKE